MQYRLNPLAFAALGLLVWGGCGKHDESADNGHDPHDGHDHSAHAGEAASAGIGPESSGVKVDMSKGWCAGHGVPESVCTRCDESLVEKFKAAGDWCAGHGLPESQCVKCNPEVKAKWAALRPGGGLAPEAHPASAPAENGGAMLPSNSMRLLTARNDPLCEVTQTQIRLADSSVADKAGIQVEPVAGRRMASVLEVPAEVEYDARKFVRVAPRVAGVVADAAADVGDVVEVGGVLAVLESAELGEAKSRYIELHENLTLARADLDRAEAVHRSTRQLLEAGTATAPAASPPPVNAASAGEVLAGDARSRLVGAQTAWTLAQAAFERATRLQTGGAVSQEAYESARAAVRRAEAEYQAARDALSYESGRSRLAAEKAVRVALNALNVAARTLQLLGVSDDQIEALAGPGQKELSRYLLRSPIQGQIIERRAVHGESVEAGAALYAVADLSTMWLEMDVPLRDSGLLQRGQPVMFTVDGLPGQSFRGRIDWISPEVDDRVRTVKARAVLPNPSGRIRAKMFGTARIGLHENSEVLSVPEEAVQTDGCCQLVFVRKSQQLYEPRKVTLGTAANGYVEIIDGLAAGEPVVTAGSFLMKTEILKSSIGAGCCEVEPGR